MNPNLILLGGSDFQLIELLSERIESSYPDKKVFKTYDAFEVCYWVQTQRPNVVILEKVFPQWDWDGYILFKFLKKDVRIKGMKSILIMDTLDEVAQEIMQDKEIDKVLFKIYNLDFIFEEIKKFI